MAQIRTFSLAYDAREDRLAWDTEDAAGVTTRLWLTQKLCKGLVAALIPMLPGAATADAPLHQATLQSWEQAAAMADFGKIPAVLPTADSASGLVTAVHITPRGSELDLVFDFGDETRRIGLSPPALRQLLAVMHGLHLAAEWPVTGWPSWIAATAADAPAMN